MESWNECRCQAFDTIAEYLQGLATVHIIEWDWPPALCVTLPRNFANETPDIDPTYQVEGADHMHTHAARNG